METRSKYLHEKRATIIQGGGKKQVQKQHERGKLTARERIKKLLDKDSFVEIDAFVKHRCIAFDMTEKEAPGEGVVTGYGTIDGRLVFLYAQDFTVINGSLGEMHAQKICKVMDMARKMGAPIIGLIDSGGARIQEGLDALKGYGEIIYRNTLTSGVIPQISAIMGPCAGAAVNLPALSDFTFMVDKLSQLFVSGPQIVKAVDGKDVTQEELGGAEICNQKSGNAHFIAQNEDECLKQIRKLLSYIPSNNLEDPPYIKNTDSPVRFNEDLNNIIPNNSNEIYDVKQVITNIVDEGDFFEVQPLFAQNIVTGFARLSGHSVGVIANQPEHKDGYIDIDSSDKATRFIRFCDAFNIPIVTLTDTPGYLPGINQEHNGIIRHAAKLLYAYSETTVPKLTVILRKAYGGAYIAMGSRHLGADQVFAWPSAEISVMNPGGAANILFKEDIKESDDPQQMRQQKIEYYRNTIASPYQAAKRGYIDDIIDPITTRAKLISALEMLKSKRQTTPDKKHGNIPV